MSALDRPGGAFDGTPVSGSKRPRRSAFVPALDADPRTDGGSTRPNTRTRAEQLRSRVAPIPDDLADGPSGGPGSNGSADLRTGEVPLTEPPTGPSIADPEPVWGPTDGPEDGTTQAIEASRPADAPYDTDMVTVVGPIVPDMRSTEVLTPLPDDRTDATPAGAPIPVVIRPVEAASPIVAPPAPKRGRGQSTFRRAPKPRIRRVRRVVRSIDTWTVFKVSAVFFIVLYAILLVAGVLLWNLAYATGTIDNLEHFFESFGWETFKFHGGQIFHSAWVAGLFLVAAGTGLAVVMATVFNLIADLVGGIGVTVLEEEVRIVPDLEPGGRRR
jgi:hypothetical protein